MGQDGPQLSAEAEVVMAGQGAAPPSQVCVQACMLSIPSLRKRPADLEHTVDVTLTFT